MLQKEECWAAVGMADTDGSKGPFERSAGAIAEQPERKWRRVLRALLAGSLNRFEATRAPVKDWCLPSTIPELEKRCLTIRRKGETVVGSVGDVHCARYWVAPESLERAHELLPGAP